MELKNRTFGKHPFTRLYAKICEEDGGLTVNIRLENHLKQEEAAWGEEIADLSEVASLMIGSLAKEFSIPRECVSIEIRMEDYRSGTQH